MGFGNLSKGVLAAREEKEKRSVIIWASDRLYGPWTPKSLEEWNSYRLMEDLFHIWTPPRKVFTIGTKSSSTVRRVGFGVQM
jgi:hypothetical protein